MCLGKNKILLISILIIAFLIRFIVAFDGLFEDNKRFNRPDSIGYVKPMMSLANDLTYSNYPDSSPALERAPGLGVFGSLFFKIFKDNAPSWIAFSLILVSVLTVYILYIIGKENLDEKVGLFAAGFYALNITSISNAPMMLTDTLFAFFVALQLLFFLRFYRNKNFYDYYFCVIIASLGVLIRPINLLWIVPATFLILVFPQINIKKRIITALFGIIIFYAILFPWMYRNAKHGASYCIDTNTGAMYHQNGAMLLSEINGISYQQNKERILQELEVEFADENKYPDEKSKVDYRLKKLKELILKHPFTWIKQHFQWRIIVPDAPTFLEILGLTTSDRGTMNVLQQHGLYAATKHYFDGKMYLILILLPLIILALIPYIAATLLLLYFIYTWRKNWYFVFIYLAFAQYYFFLPGPITVPRYQLPALMIICIMTGIVCCNLKKIKVIFLSLINKQ